MYSWNPLGETADGLPSICGGGARRLRLRDGVRLPIISIAVIIDLITIVIVSFITNAVINNISDYNALMLIIMIIMNDINQCL